MQDERAIDTTGPFPNGRIHRRGAVRVAGDDLAMAKARLAQAEASAAKAKLDLGRMTRLLAEKAVTRDAFEKTEVAAKSHAAALGGGAGSELRQSMGVGSVGGILVSSLVSLYFIPALCALKSLGATARAGDGM